MFRCGWRGRCGGGRGLSLRVFGPGWDGCVGKGGFVGLRYDLGKRMRGTECASGRGLLGSSAGGELGIYLVMWMKRVKNTGRAGLYL